MLLSNFNGGVSSFKLARLVKGCRLAVVRRAGHCPQQGEPELFADIVTSCVSRHAAVPQ
jgi:pimeloyl-ACP methyl ester carboxylesterase